MSLNAKYFEAASEALSRRRAANAERLALRKSEVRRRIPEYAMLENKLSDTMTGLIPTIMERSPDMREKLDKIRQENLAISAEMSRLLEQNGFPPDYLEPECSCKLCGDSGIVTRNGECVWCDCFKRLLNDVAASEWSADMPQYSFASFKLTMYPETIDKSLGRSCRQIMSDNYDECAEFAESFNGYGKGLFMMGGTGLGKTHLSLAAANRIMERGYSVVYGSVPELLRTLEREQFGKSDGDTMSLLVGCDLLVMDDLGAEMKSERCISQIYEIINARMSRSLPMIISTNLSMEDIKSRYQDRIWSRLFSMNVLIFKGTDNRLKQQ